MFFCVPESHPSVYFALPSRFFLAECDALCPGEGDDNLHTVIVYFRYFNYCMGSMLKRVR